MLNTRRVCLIVALAATSSFLTACDQTPSENQGRQIFETRLQKQLGSTPYSIDSFKKTNGQPADVMGMKVYRLFYSASVSLPQGFHPECVQHGNQFVGFNCMMQFSDPSKLRPQSAGATVSYNEEIDFQKTENGWIAG
jgi:hypothetical protein